MPSERPEPVERIAWVADDLGRLLEVERVRKLVGRGLVGGRYFEIAYPEGKPLFPAAGFHALDYGVELDFDDGSTWSFVWQQAGENEALLAYEGTLIGAQLREDQSFGVWPIDELPGWAHLIGTTVTAVDSAWDDFGSDLCPVTWTLAWHGGAWVCMTLGTSDLDTGRFRGSHDDVAVFFSEDTARASGVRLPD